MRRQTDDFAPALIATVRGIKRLEQYDDVLRRQYESGRSTAKAMGALPNVLITRRFKQDMPLRSLAERIVGFQCFVESFLRAPIVSCVVIDTLKPTPETP